MAIRQVVTRGFGSFATIPQVIVRGYFAPPSAAIGAIRRALLRLGGGTFWKGVPT